MQTFLKMEKNLTIFEIEKNAKIEAHKILELAKRQEEKKKSTHSWVSIDNGKNKIYRKNEK